MSETTIVKEGLRVKLGGGESVALPTGATVFDAFKELLPKADLKSG